MEEDIRQAFALPWFDGLMEGYTNKFLLTGFDTRGNLIEVMYNLLDEETAWVFHAVPPGIPDIAKPVLGETYADDDRSRSRRP